MGILCVFCVYDTIGNRCFEKTSFPKMANVSAFTKGVHKKLFSDISLTDDQSLMNLEQITPPF